MKVLVLYRDASLFVIVKPAGMLSQSDNAGRENVVSWLEEEFVSPVFPVHRLDRETGGVMVYARTKSAAAALSASLQNHAFRKEYLAVLLGAPAEQSGEYRDLLFRDAVKNKSFVVQRMRHGVKEAVLSYQTEQTKNGLSLVRIRLETGRTHQIRVQFSSRGTPLLGDRKYGGAPAPALSLFCTTLSFPHPTAKKEMSFSALPDSLPPWNLFLS